MTTLDKIKAKIQKVLDTERDFTSENAKAQALALNWVLELFDKYAEQEPCDKCKYFDGNSCQHYDYKVGYTQGYEDASKNFRQEPISVSVSEKEPDEISEEVTLRFFRNTLKVRWQDMVIYNVEWLKKNWQMEMDIVCGVKPCDDAISREDALEALNTINGTAELDKAFEVIEKLPSVRPQEQTGHWISHYDEDAKEGWYECDRCHTERAFNTDYCPDCGARMVEQRETETWHGIHAQITAPKGTFERIFNEADDDYDI